jgi:microsomal dipeptidase-like Zn-dependent dipeptidase
MAWMKKTLLRTSIIVVTGCLLFFFLLPVLLDKFLNHVVGHPAHQPSPQAITLHKKLLIADLHADCLLWNRNLLDRNTRGHVDLPRLIEGNVTLQAFTVVTKMPPVFDDDGNAGSIDLITPLAVAQGWPMKCWRSLKERARYQAEKFHDLAASSSGKLVVIKSTNDLSTYLERRKQENDLTAGFLGLEGAHALDGDLANLNDLFDAGFRMMAATHFFDNEIGGSAHGTKRGGLTEMGREMIRRMEAKKMIVDLAHASPQVIRDVVAMSTRPVVISHTGVRGTCDNNRNVSDEVLRLVAGTGGVIGIGFWETAVCGDDAKAIAYSMRYVTNLVGVEHVGLGSDFDGAVPQPFDATGLVQITDTLLAEGFGEDDIEKIMGGNVLRLLLENLP